MEDQDEDEALEARIPDCNIAPPQEWVQGRHLIQNPDREDDLPWVQEEDEWFYLQDEGGIPPVGPEEGKCRRNLKTGGNIRKKKNKVSL